MWLLVTASGWGTSLFGGWGGNPARSAGWQENGTQAACSAQALCKQVVTNEKGESHFIWFLFFFLFFLGGVLFGIQGGVCYNVERLELFLVQPKDLTSIDFSQGSNCIPARQDFFRRKPTLDRNGHGRVYTYPAPLIGNMHEAALLSSSPAFSQHPEPAAPARHCSNVTRFRKLSTGPLLALIRLPQHLTHTSDQRLRWLFMVCLPLPVSLSLLEGKDWSFFISIFPHNDSFWPVVSSKQTFAVRTNYLHLVADSCVCVFVCCGEREGLVNGRTIDITDQLWARALKTSKILLRRQWSLTFCTKLPWFRSGISISRPYTCCEHYLLIKKLIFFRTWKKIELHVWSNIAKVKNYFQIDY